jgi:esterase/lipase superfamily enzyme
MMLCVLALHAQDFNNTTAKVLNGTVTIDTNGQNPDGSARNVPAAAVDAVVTFCEEGPKVGNMQPNYKVILSTVTDANGAFALVIGDLTPAKKYALRVRALESDGWVTQDLGSGADEATWTKPVNIGHALRHRHHEPPTDATPFYPYGDLSVLFATDREVDTASSAVKITNINNASGELSLGRCDVTVGRVGNHDSLLNVFTSTDPEAYYSVGEIVPESQSAFWADFVKGIKNDGSAHDALLFIHGYNSSFNDACRRAAQIAYDLKFDGAILLYSWPSHDSLLSYAGDEDMTEWSGPHFDSFLKQILKQPGLGHLHIIAHSMGNRILARTLFSGNLTSQETAHLGQVVFAAPDVNRLIFDQYQCDKLKAQRITLYASDRDQALAVSKLVHGFSRAGDARPTIDVRPGMDSIDASAVDTGLLGHSYIGDSRPVLVDVADLIVKNEAPGKRIGLTREGHSPGEWWLIKP